MTTYYVDYVNGSDANNGLGPDASAVSNKPWKTITKLLGAAGMASGDTAYLSPAGPFREVLTVAMTSPTVETKIIGDPLNLRGFKTAAGVLVEPGPVTWTAYTTNDTTAPSSSSVLGLAGRDFLTFQSIQFIGREAIISATGDDATNITFTECAFLGTGTGGNNQMINVAFATAIPWVWRFDRCYFWGFNNGARNITLQPTRHGSADYDIDVKFTNCVLYAGIYCTTNGGAAFKPGGVLIYNCFIFQMGGGDAFYVDTGQFSTSIPCQVENCFILTGSNGVHADTLGQIVEDYNVFWCSTPRVTVLTGTHSTSDRSYSPLFNWGQENIWGESQRPWGSIQKGAPALLGFNVSANVLAVDAQDKPRPAGGLGQPGAYARGNTWAKETGTVRTGAAALSITGPGYQEFDLAVDAVSTTVSVYMRCDSTYAGTKPTMSVLDGAEAGVADATSSAVSAANAWEQLTLTFTPTAKGIVTIRLNSTDTNGGGKAFADDLAVS